MYKESDYQNSKAEDIKNPDDFYLGKKTEDDNWVSIFNLEEDCVKRISNDLGFYVKIEESREKRGAFVDKKDVKIYLKDRDYIKEGTLLGFFPGVSYPKRLKEANEDDSSKSFLEISGDRLLDTAALVPFPNPNNQSMSEFDVLLETVQDKNIQKLDFTFTKGINLNFLAIGNQVE